MAISRRTEFTVRLTTVTDKTSIKALHQSSLSSAVVGLSQGGIIVRAYVEQYAGTASFYPPVVNLGGSLGYITRA
jgi:hypothetical protein